MDAHDLDLDDEVLAQLDVVVASVHSYMNLDRAAMTERMLAAIENPYTQIVAHPTGRLLLRRDSFEFDGAYWQALRHRTSESPQKT